jgi:hypothetical protein
MGRVRLPKVWVVGMETRKEVAVWALLNCVAAAFYFVIATEFEYLQNLYATIFSISDSRQYKRVADWVFGFSNAPLPHADRPVLYPLLLGIEYYAGIHGIWLMHFIFWISTINVTSLAVRRLAVRRCFYVIAFIFVSINTSFIFLTFFALTEATALFLSSLWVLLLATSALPQVRKRDIFGLTSLLSLLVILKPVYMVPLGIFLLLVTLLCWSQRGDRCKCVALLLLALLPVGIQIGVGMRHSQSASLLDRARLTFREYYFIAVFQTVEKVPDRQSARILVRNYNDTQMVAYLYRNTFAALKTFAYNVIKNVRTTSNFIDAEKYPGLLRFNLGTNLFYSYLHIIFLPVVVYALRVRNRSFAFKCGFLYLFSLVMLIVSGFSYYQGDRLTIAALPLWLVAYLWAASDWLPPQRAGSLVSLQP